MQLQSLKTYFQNNLLGYYPENEIISFFRLLSEAGLGYKPVDIVLNAEKVVDAKSFHLFQDAIERLQSYEPIQYILGETYFYGLRFKVDQSVLIPRPETEELVDWIINDQNNYSIRILDIGTGSGCIPITLATHLPKATVHTLDISNEALNLAKDNAKSNAATVNFIEANILEAAAAVHLASLPKFDVIVSNPPYVRLSEKELMKENVVNFEPHLALFVEDNDALIFYKKIIALSKDVLNKGGSLYFEINEALGEGIKRIMEPDFESIVLRKDLSGKDRMIKGTKK